MASDKEFQELENRTRDLLSKMEGIGEAEPTQYLRARVLARIEERANAKKGFLIWQRLGIGFGTLSLILGLGLYVSLSRVPAYDGLVNRAMLVKLEVTDLALEDVAYAEVQLPRDVEFYSKKFPNLALQKTLRVEWQNTSPEVPFVIRGLVEGKRKLLVHFFDKNGKKVAQREIAIQFKST